MLYWGIVILLSILVAAWLKIEDTLAMKKRVEKDLPLYPLDSTAPYPIYKKESSGLKTFKILYHQKMNKANIQFIPPKSWAVGFYPT